MDNGKPLLPEKDQLGGLLRLSVGSEVSDLMMPALLEPLQDFLGRPGKRFRSQLVEAGFALSGEHGTSTPTPQESEWIAAAARALEALHAGSLVIDDIEDESSERRGAPTLHRQYGVPLALNAGNWLYFWPLKEIEAWGLDAGRELKLHRLCAEALLRAHFGQALDVGVRIERLPQARIPSVCLASLELKTGALMALGIGMGAILGRAPDPRFEMLSVFGRRFGVALQMFDDIANLRLKEGDPKRFEDLRLGRPSWVWATVAESVGAEEFAAFVTAVSRLPEPGPVVEWLERFHWMTGALKEAERRLSAAVQELGNALSGAGDFEDELSRIHQLAERLGRAYV